jgi:hypothetical protein
VRSCRPLSFTLIVFCLYDIRDLVRCFVVQCLLHVLYCSSMLWMLWFISFRCVGGIVLKKTIIGKTIAQVQVQGLYSTAVAEIRGQRLYQEEHLTLFLWIIPVFVYCS